MKKTLLALTILGFALTGADAQTKTTTTTVKKETVTITTNNDKNNKNYKVCKDKSKYYVCGDKPATTKTKATKVTKQPDAALVADKSENAKNFKVCKGTGDYHICDQHPNGLNSTPRSTKVLKTGAASKTREKTTTVVTPNGVVATSSTQAVVPAGEDFVAPKSQSLNGAVTNNSLILGDTKNDTINNATAPYNGKPSPQYDGPEKNKQRNLNTPPGSPNSSPGGTAPAGR